MTEESELTKMAWVLSYMQGGVAEAWKDNLLDELSCQCVVVRTQSSTKVVVQEELNRVPYWIPLGTYTNIRWSVCLPPTIT